ncbi:MAG: hypothetical protein N2167_10475 [Flavobacteriales bacterium]|nr:hypothetical protein [Flavobacteriales bacterium]
MLYSDVTALHYQSLSSNFNKLTFKGTLADNYSLTMEISGAKTNDSEKPVELKGHYFYDNLPMKIYLQGYVHADGSVVLQELVNGKITGVFNGNVSEQEFKGTWTGTRTQNQYGFRLSAFIPTGVAQLEMKHIRTTNRKCGNLLPEKCSSFDVIYPTITNSSASLAINTAIEDQIASFTHIKTSSFNFSSIEEELQYALSQVEGVNTELVVTVEMNKENILTLLYFHSESENDAPGAITSFVYQNFNMQTGNLITLDDLFIKGFESFLGEKIQNSINTRNGKADFINNSFFITNNFEISEKGILFQYNAQDMITENGQIPSIFFTYCELEEILNPSGIYFPFIKARMN